MNDNHKLGDFLREVSNWDWEQFCLAENDPKFTSNEAVIFAVIRACAMEKMEAIKLALNRLDGKLKTPVRVEFPKVFFLYPNAKPSKNVEALATGMDEEPESQMVPLESEPEEGETDLPSLTLRQTLAKMADHPRRVPDAVVEFALQTQQWLKHPDKIEEPIEKPMVKSVVAAHLLKLAQSRNIDALSEVFDQIDGKLVETIQILGDDLYITSYARVAPPGAYLNKDGVVQAEGVESQTVWAEKLGASSGR